MSRTDVAQVDPRGRGAADDIHHTPHVAPQPQGKLSQDDSHVAPSSGRQRRLASLKAYWADSSAWSALAAEARAFSAESSDWA